MCSRELGNPLAQAAAAIVDTSSAAQERPIMQGLADGHAVVVGHDGEKIKLDCV